MIADGHVHMGYFLRSGFDDPFYYSPRRVVGMLMRCGVDQFIVSSTNCQVDGISVAEVVREAREMRRLADTRAYQFLWISGRIFDEDPMLKSLDVGLYVGVKLHGIETPWLGDRRENLRRVLDVIAERSMLVQLHTGCDACCHPYEWGKFAQSYPMIKMDFAHCRPLAATLEVMRACPNVYTDISFLQREEANEVLSSDVADRVMFGSDFPAYHAQDHRSFAKTYREKLAGYSGDSLGKMTSAFQRFVET